jgi:hypothetical protein
MYRYYTITMAQFKDLAEKAKLAIFYASSSPKPELKTVGKEDLKFIESIFKLVKAKYPNGKGSHNLEKSVISDLTEAKSVEESEESYSIDSKPSPHEMSPQF